MLAGKLCVQVIVYNNPCRVVGSPRAGGYTKWQRHRLDHQRTKGKNKKGEITCISRYERRNFNDDLRYCYSKYRRSILLHQRQKGIKIERQKRKKRGVKLPLLLKIMVFV